MGIAEEIPCVSTVWTLILGTLPGNKMVGVLGDLWGLWDAM